MTILYLSLLYVYAAMVSYVVGDPCWVERKKWWVFLEESKVEDCVATWAFRSAVAQVVRRDHVAVEELGVEGTRVEHTASLRA